MSIVQLKYYELRLSHLESSLFCKDHMAKLPIQVGIVKNEINKYIVYKYSNLSTLDIEKIVY